MRGEFFVTNVIVLLSVIQKEILPSVLKGEFLFDFIIIYLEGDNYFVTNALPPPNQPFPPSAPIPPERL